MSRHTCDKFHAWGVVILSMAVFALGVANLTVQCTSPESPCQSHENGELFDVASEVFFLAVGIWTAVPCLLVGIGMIRQLKKPNFTTSWLWMKLISSLYFFTPLLVVFSAFNTVQAVAHMDSSPSTRQSVMFAVPLSAAIIGGIIHVKLMIAYCHFVAQMKKQKKSVAPAAALGGVYVSAAPSAAGNCGCGSAQTGRCTCGGAVVKPASGGCGCGAGKATAWHTSSAAAGHTNCNCYSPYGVAQYGR